MQHSFFITMDREESSLSELLDRARDQGCKIVEITARSSLDDALFFVRLGVEAEISAERISQDLRLIDSVKRIDVGSSTELATAA